MSNQQNWDSYASAAASSSQPGSSSRQHPAPADISSIPVTRPLTSSIKPAANDDWLAEYKKDLKPTPIVPFVAPNPLTHPNPTTANRPFAYGAVKDPGNISMVDYWFDSRAGSSGPIPTIGWPAERGEVLKPWGTKAGFTGFNLGDDSIPRRQVDGILGPEDVRSAGAMTGGAIASVEVLAHGMPSQTRKNYAEKAEKGFTGEDPGNDASKDNSVRVEPLQSLNILADKLRSKNHISIPPFNPADVFLAKVYTDRYSERLHADVKALFQNGVLRVETGSSLATGMGGISLDGTQRPNAQSSSAPRAVVSNFHTTEIGGNRFSNAQADNRRYSAGLPNVDYGIRGVATGGKDFGNTQKLSHHPCARLPDVGPIHAPVIGDQRQLVPGSRKWKKEQNKIEASSRGMNAGNGEDPKVDSGAQPGGFAGGLSASHAANMLHSSAVVALEKGGAMERFDSHGALGVEEAKLDASVAEFQPGKPAILTD